MRILVLGFDGASPILIERWIQDLPTIRFLRSKGIYGRTVPPIPAQTPVAWTTFMTGKNPGKHGVFSFATRRVGTYERVIMRPDRVQSKTLWRILSEGGRRVGVINVPMSRAEEVRGFIIPGFLSRDEGVPHPSPVREKIKRRFGVERVVGDVEPEFLVRVHEDPDTFFERVNQITDGLAEVSLHLLQEEEWDFFMVVFMMLDRIQHFFWRFVDPSHPNYEEGRPSGLVKEAYLRMDRIVQDFLHAIDEETMVMVLSDHGFCPVHKEVFINNYLEELGLLRISRGQIDLKRSKAVSYGYGDIWLNVRGREPHGIVNPGAEYEELRSQIIDELRKIAVDGEAPIKDIKRREEIYWGPHLHTAPDLITIFNVGWQAARNPEFVEKTPSRRYVNDHPRWSGGHDGTHDPSDVPGFLAIYHPELQPRIGVRVPLWSLAPTILALMDIPIPVDMDGKPLLGGV